jgi:fumarylacetoacetate (FAA) hydrolase
VEEDGRKSWPRGYSCIAEKRAMETILDGQPSTGFMKFGDTIRIEMKGKDGQSLFGAIDQRIAPLAAASDAARQPGPSSAPASIRA